MAKESPIRAAINELEGEYLLLEPPEMDVAIVGLVSQCGRDPVVCYDRNKIVQVLMKQDGMDFDEADEFCSVNIEGAYLGEASPVFITTAKQLLGKG